MKNLLAIVLLIGLGGNIVSSSLPDIFKEMSEWTMEIETEKESNEIEKLDSDIDEVWTNHHAHHYKEPQYMHDHKTNDWYWIDIHQRLVSPPPEV